MAKRNRISKSPSKRQTLTSIDQGKQPDGPPVIYTQHPGVVYVPSATDPAGKFKVEIDKVVLFELAETHASYEQMGRILMVDANVLQQEEYKQIIELARAQKVSKLLSAQFKAAIEDRNPTMLIWLGKQYADQKDISTRELTGPDGKPIQAEVGPRMVAHIPPNGRDLSAARRGTTALPGTEAAPLQLVGGEVRNTPVPRPDEKTGT